MKSIFKRLFRCKLPKLKAEKINREFVVTIDQDVKPVNVGSSVKVVKKENLSSFTDVVLTCISDLIWIIAVSFYFRFIIAIQNGEGNFYVYLALGCIVVIFIAGVVCVQNESNSHGKITFDPKITVVLKKNPTQKRILRMKKYGDTEFIENEIDEADLTYHSVLKLCCKELGLTEDHVKCLWKIPKTRIRNDEDVKRFRRLEYVEVRLKE